MVTRSFDPIRKIIWAGDFSWVGFMPCFLSSTLAPEKCFTTMSSWHFAAFQMVCTYLFFNIESPKITVVRVFVLMFLYNIFSSLSLLESELLLSAGLFSFKSCIFFFFFWCRLAIFQDGSLKKNLYWCLLFSFLSIYKGSETGIRVYHYCY